MVVPEGIPTDLGTVGGSRRQPWDVQGQVELRQGVAHHEAEGCLRNSGRWIDCYRLGTLVAYNLWSTLTFPNSIAPMDTQQPRRQIPETQFRVLIIGRANAGKPSILQRLCETTESRRIYCSGCKYKKVHDPNFCLLV